VGVQAALGSPVLGPEQAPPMPPVLLLDELAPAPPEPDAAELVVHPPEPLEPVDDTADAEVG
jgi:hypothetical protein